MLSAEVVRVLVLAERGRVERAAETVVSRTRHHDHCHYCDNDKESNQS